MNEFQAELVRGLAMAQAARGAQNSLSMAGQPPLVLGSASRTRHTVKQQAVNRCGLRDICSNPPNAIKVGASSDLERSTPLSPYL